MGVLGCPSGSEGTAEVIGPEMDPTSWTLVPTVKVTGGADETGAYTEEVGTCWLRGSKVSTNWEVAWSVSC